MCVAQLRCRENESPVAAIRSFGIGADAKADVIGHPGDAHDDRFFGEIWRVI